jgi:hypothetical protein
MLGGGSGPPPSAKGNHAPDFLRGADAIVWARDYSAEDAAKCDCAKLEEALKVGGSGVREQGHGCTELVDCDATLPVSC